MNDLELGEFRNLVAMIMGKLKHSDAEKRRAIAMLWINLETNEIENAAQYEACKEEYRAIEVRARGVSCASDFSTFLKSPEGQGFLRSQDAMRWMALGGAIMKWEDDARAAGVLLSGAILG